MRAYGKRLDGFFDQLGEIEFLVPQAHAAALDLGEVENIVEQLHQGAAVEA